MTKKGLVLQFQGENEEIMRRMVELSEKDGNNPADDVATIIELFLDGRLVLRKGAK